MSKKDWQLLKAYMATGMAPEDFQRLKNERDELLEILKKKGDCEFCANDSFCPHDCPYDCDCEGCNLLEECPCYTCDRDGNWQWRGVKEE